MIRAVALIATAVLLACVVHAGRPGAYTTAIPTTSTLTTRTGPEHAQ